MMSRKENYRDGDGPGPDYKCHKCGLWGYRMWRMGASSCVELTCAVCSEKDQAEKIAYYAKVIPRRKDVPECTIGDLVPCRVDEDQSIWGHTSGDTAWWYRMRQYVDPVREEAQLRLERDHFADESERYGQMWLKADREANQMRRERDEAFRVAKIKRMPE